MKPTDDDFHNLLGMLRPVHLHKKAPPVDDRWQNELMRRIRHTAERQARLSFFQSIGIMVWKMTPVTSVMIVACLIALLKFGFISDWQILQLLSTGLTENAYFDF